MIISHRHKFIFIKTRKTAGTSVEIALSKFCGPEDILTPINAEDESIRKELGYPGPQNHQIPFSKYSPYDWLKAAYTRRRILFFNHASAAFIMRHIDQNIWDSYFKFCFERNPWDKAISWYYWKNQKEPRPSIAEFLRSNSPGFGSDFPLYTKGSKIAVDRIFKFEDLNPAMEEIRRRLGLPETPRLVFAKAHYRKDPRNYREILSEEEKNEIARLFSREIAQLGYRW
jgi:hypothetical protein